MIFQYKNSTYCLTDWGSSHSGKFIYRRMVSLQGKALENEYIGFQHHYYNSYSSYVIAAQGILKEVLSYYIMCNESALLPITTNKDFSKAKEDIDMFLSKVDKLKAFV